MKRMNLERVSAIGQLIAHHGGITAVSKKLGGVPAYQEIQRWAKRGWASPMHLFRLEPLLPEGMSLRDLAADRNLAATVRDAHQAAAH
jgi:hypothetical protein